MSDADDEEPPQNSLTWPPASVAKLTDELMNRGGRLKGTDRTAVVRRIAFQSHIINQPSGRKRYTTLELVLLAIRARSLDGEPRAVRALHDLLQRYAPQEPSQPAGALILPAQPPPEVWEAIVEAQQRPARQKARRTESPSGDTVRTPKK